MKKTNQSGFSTVEALLVLVVVGILGFTGWYVYHSRNVADKGYGAADAQSQTANSQYVSFGPKGLTLTTRADVSKLTGAGPALKQYFDTNLGLPVSDPATFGTSSTKTVPQTFTVYSVYGSYATAEGNSDNFGSILGPEAGGKVGVLVASQDGWNCSKLTAAHVPAALVAGKCSDSSGKVVTYKG